VAGFRSEWWPLSNRNHGRLQIGTVAGFKSEKVAAFDWNLQRGGKLVKTLGSPRYHLFDFIR
jgi:hypothetical protein